MDLLDYAEGRIDAFLHEIEKLGESEFPYSHSKQALDVLRIRYREEKGQLNRLRRLRNTPDAKDTIRERCGGSLRLLATDPSLLGFILRSTNVRNAFEVYGPLLKICRQLLGDQAKLILSSEWSYIPHTYPYSTITNLPEFVLIGLPAPESSNPLLLPLAGHELGHSIWRHRKIEEKIRARLMKAIENSLGHQEPSERSNELTTEDSDVPIHKWRNAHILAMHQAQESFCDFIGLGIFGAAYPNAFAYLVSPGYSGTRSARYPKLSRRVSDIKKAAGVYHVEIGPDYEHQFLDEADPKTSEQEPNDVQLADQASAAIVNDLISLAQDVVKTPTADSSSGTAEDRAERLRKFVPIEHSGGLANILNAGWTVYKELLHPPSSDQPDEGLPRDKIRALHETILKSIEVYEIETITAPADHA